MKNAMSHYRLRRRIWLAVGLSPLATPACAQRTPAQEPDPPRTEVAINQPDSEFAQPPPDAGELVETDPKPDPDPKGIPEVPASAWTVQAASGQSWCPKRPVRCQPRRDTIAAAGAAAADHDCPAAIAVRCVCTPASPCMNPAEPCSAAFDVDVSREQRQKTGDACCYSLPQTCVPPYVGRPLCSPNGDLVTARSMLRRDWSCAWTESASDTKKWLRIAELEHASVASFARVSLSLLALAAPAELVADVHRAALDEVEHAKIAYALAGGNHGPAGLDLAPLALPCTNFATLAQETFLQACVEETVGAVVAKALAQDSDTPRALQRIAADEERHAILAFRILAFALSRGGEPAATALEAAFGQVELGEPGSTRRAAIRDVVFPCARALLSGARTTAPTHSSGASSARRASSAARSSAVTSG